MYIVTIKPCMFHAVLVNAPTGETRTKKYFEVSECYPHLCATMIRAAHVLEPLDCPGADTRQVRVVRATGFEVLADYEL
jgi:hypothetical protein